ncbi:MAG: TerB family tellurite resistance protein [Desulfobacterales bacterium]|nr:MAG: TerB family tellurite resistance protein [Desulfobacterales bacterium]
MSNETFIMDLAKLLIAAAWVDGELSNEEINALKDLLFTIPDISGEDWKQLEIYMDSPVTSEEREALLARVLTSITSNKDKTLVIDTLTRLFAADGKISDEESALLNDIKEALSKTHTGVLARMSKIITTSVKRRNETSKAATQRESRIDDYIMNTVYYQLESEHLERGFEVNLPEQQIRKLCFAAGLLARIAAVDSGISKKERNSIQFILTQEWGLSAQEAALVTEVSCQRVLKGLDFYRTTRGFFECTDHDERKSFLQCLFNIANASDMTSAKEVEEIRRISEALKLSHKDFIEAKLTIPRQNREVL